MVLSVQVYYYMLKNITMFKRVYFYVFKNKTFALFALFNINNYITICQIYYIRFHLLENRGAHLNQTVF